MLVSPSMLRARLLLAAPLACASHGEPEALPTRPEAPAPAASVEPPIVPRTSLWTTVSVDRGCAVQVADAPADLGVPLRWGPCPDGPQGCREAVDGSASSVGGSITGLAHGDRVTIAVSTSLPGMRLRHVLAPLDGLPFLAVEGPRDPQCSIGGVSLTDDGAAIEVTHDHHEGFASRAYLRGPLRDDPAWRTIAAVLPRREFPDFIGASALSAGGRVVVEQSGGPLRWYDAANKRWNEIPGSRAGWECCARGHGEFVTFLIESIPERAMAARLGEPAHPLRRDPVDGISPVAIDGARAVWIEGRTRDRNNIYRRVELWAGELSPNLTLESATMVTALPRRTMATPALGGGVVAIPLEDRGNGLAVVRLGSTDMRVLRAPPDLMIERLLWVAADELAVQIGPGTMAEAPSRVQRIPLAVLPGLPPGG